MALLAVAAVGALAGCNRNELPSGPRILIPPTYTFTAGHILLYSRRNFDQNHNPVSVLEHAVEVLATGGTIGGVPNAATVLVSTSGSGPMRFDTAAMAVAGGKLVIYDARAQVPGRIPPLPSWNPLVNLGLSAVPDTLLSFDSTFTVPMASGNILSDRVSCRVETRYVAEDAISAFGSPIVNCFVFLRTVSCEETVDTAGVILFQGPVVTLLDSIWFADGIGPVKMTSRGSTLEVDSLGFPFTLSPFQVVRTPSSLDSYEVHYARVGGRDSLALRESLFFVPPLVYTETIAYAKNY